MSRILIVADEPGWVFERHAKEIKKRLTKYSIDIAYRKQNIPELSKNYDLVYVMDPIPLKHGYPPKNKTIMGLRCEFLYEEHPEGAEGLYKKGFPGRCVSIQDKCKALHVVNKRQMEVMGAVMGNDPLYLAQHGVDHEIFDLRKCLPQQMVESHLVIGTAGRRSGNKGFHLIESACKDLGMQVHTAEYGKRKLSKEEMPEYYAKLDVYVCMSQTEGLNNGILEAGAMKLPVISTDVGAAREIIEDGVNGLIIGRTEAELKEALKKLEKAYYRCKMGDKMYDEIMENWTWSKRILDFQTMFDKELA